MSLNSHPCQPARVTTTGPNGTLPDLPYSTNTAGLISASNATAALSQLGETYSYDALDQIVDAKLPSGQGSTQFLTRDPLGLAGDTAELAHLAHEADLY